MPQATARINPPFRGLVTNKDPQLLADNEASDMNNVILTENGIECRRAARGLGTTGFATGGSGATGFTDAFGRADNATVGNGWNELETNGAWAISSGKVVWTPSGGASIGFLTQAPVSRSGYIQADLSCTPAGGSESGALCMRKNGNGNTACYVAVFPGATGTAEYSGVGSLFYPAILYYNGTTYTLLSAYYSNSTVTTYYVNATPKTFRFVALGNFLAIYFWSGSAWTCLTSCIDYSISGTTAYRTAALHALETTMTFDNVYINADHAVTGMKTFRLNNGAFFNLLKSGESIQNVTPVGTASTITNNGSVVFGGSVPSWAQYGNRLYFCDGTAAPKITDGSNVYDITITAPSGAVTLADGAGTLNTGIYDYKYTYYSSTWGIESAASPVSAQIDIDTSDVDISGMSVSGDSRVDKHRIYRRKISLDGIPQESDWSLVEEIAEATTYTDDTLDNDVDHNKKCPSSAAPTYLDFTTMAFFAGRMWYAGSSNGRSQLYYSKIGQPAAIDGAAYLIVGGDEGDSNPITAIVESYGSLIVMKRRGIYQVTGTSAETFFVSAISASAGCTAVGSVQKVEDALYWAGYDAIYRWAGMGMPEQLSACIEPTYRARIKAADILMTSVDDKKHGMIYWNYWGSDDIDSRLMLVYFYRQSEKLGVPCWGMFKFNTVAKKYGVSCVASMQSQRDGSEEVWWGFHGFDDETTYQGSWAIGVYQHDGATYSEYHTTADSTEEINWSWTTGKIDGGAIEKIKHWDKIFLSVKRQGSSTNNMTITPYYDNDTAMTAITGDMYTDSIIDGKMGPVARMLKLKFSGSSGQAAQIFSWAITGFPESKAQA